MAILELVLIVFTAGTLILNTWQLSKQLRAFISAPADRIDLHQRSFSLMMVSDILLSLHGCIVQPLGL